MKKYILSILLVASVPVFAQPINGVFNSAFTKFAGDPDLKHATIGLFVVNTKTGKPVTEVNIQTGLAPASTLKTITSATAYALLGKDFTYKTTLSYTGTIENGVLNGDIIIKGNGDPTLGSWRYAKTGEKAIIDSFKNAISQAGINAITGRVIVDEGLWKGEITPDGWTWQDLGSYYGAASRPVNWRENQYDLILKSGNKLNDSVNIVGTVPSYIAGLNLRSAAVAAAKGTGDNAYIYYPQNFSWGYVRGTIPMGESNFKISGSIPHPGEQLAITLESAIKNIPITEIAKTYSEEGQTDKNEKLFYTYESVGLDSISYWFLKKSVNLYGEAFMRTLSYQLANSGETAKGIKVMQDFWQKQNIFPYALNIQDGSGLSPSNRITAKTLVEVLLYTKKQDWFASYFDGFPVINGIKMKSGSIKDVVSYTGFIKSKTGDEYVFAFIVNNYNGGGNAMRQKMWKLLDVLK